MCFIVPWQIKRIHVENLEDPDKFDRLITAIRESRSIPGYSTILWKVGTKVGLFNPVKICISRMKRSNSGKYKQALGGFSTTESAQKKCFSKCMKEARK